MKRKVGKGKKNVEKKKVDSLTSILNIFGILAVIACVFSVGYLAGSNWGSSSIPSSFRLIGDPQNEDVTELNFNLFWDVWQDLQTKYVDDGVTEDTLFYGSIKGLVDSVDDPVTVFLTPDETQDYLDSNEGKFEGIGAELGYNNGDIIIVAPLAGSPAYKAGLKSQDIIKKVDDENISEMNIYEVVALIRGDQGTEVILTVTRDDEELDIVITRGEITVPSVALDTTDDGIAVIDLDRFTESSASAWISRWDSIVEEVEESDPDGVILDMRGNPGGYFNAAVWAAGDFLDNGSLVSKQVDRDGSEILFNVKRVGNLLDIPLVVLVDEGSASASEILAGALQYYDRAYIIGENTFGKGTAQEILSYSGGSSLHITTLNWVLPDGRVLSEEDVIEPDKVVELDEEDFVQGEDPQLDEAYKYLGIEN